MSSNVPNDTDGTLALLHDAVALLHDMKGEDLVALDLREVSSVCDYFLIVSGGSEQHVRAMASRLIKELSRRGHKPLHREGEAARRWVLVDYVDVVVHIFHHETRAYYRLENLWADATRVPLDPRPADRALPPGSE